MKNTLHYEKHTFLKKCTTRKDHYNGQNALYRLSAVIYYRSKKNRNVELQYLIEKLKTWTVLPNEIVVFPKRLEIHWYAKGYQMALNREQYLVLIQNYILFLNSIKEFNICFLERCLIENPDRTVWGVPNENINFKPSFNSQCFGLEGHEIKVLYLTDRLESVA